MVLYGTYVTSRVSLDVVIFTHIMVQISVETLTDETTSGKHSIQPSIWPSLDLQAHRPNR